MMSFCLSFVFVGFLVCFEGSLRITAAILSIYLIIFNITLFYIAKLLGL